MSRAVPYFCPYCAEEDLHPHAEGGWECRSCARVFKVQFLGLRVSDDARTPALATTTTTGTRTETDDDS